MTDILALKNATKFYCKSCDFTCCKKSNFDKHVLTLKHKNTDKLLKNTDAENAENAVVTDYFICECGRQYKHRQSLWNHRKICPTHNSQLETNNLPIETNVLPSLEPNIMDQIDPNKIMDKDKLIKYLIKENSEFKDMLVEQNKMVMKMCEKSLETGKTINNNTNCNNINNNSFNLNLFLNEKCKDAINISDFVNNIKLQLSDLEHFGNMGYVEGVSKILIKNLNELDAYKRPIHCSDLKREVLYIKDDDKWSKEDNDKLVIKKAIKDVANKNIKQITDWINLHPDCKQSESKKNNQYLNIVMNSMSGGSNEEQVTNISQIVKNVAKVVTIDKV
jgi:hypothetical protein